MRHLIGWGIAGALALTPGCQSIGEDSVTEAQVSSDEWLSAKAEIYRELAKRSLHGGDPDRTLKLLTEAVQFEQGDVESIQLLARLHLASGDLMDARTCVAWWLRLEPQSVSALCLAGIIEESLENMEAAERLYCLAIEADERDPMPLIDLHTFLLNNGRLTDAAVMRRRVLEQFPNRYEVLLDYGAFLESRGEWGEALMVLQEVRDLQPADLDLAVRVGTAALLVENDEAMERLEEELPPRARTENVSLALILAAVRLRAGDKEGVLLELDLLEKAGRHDPVISLLRGEILMAGDDLSGAEIAFQEALRQDSSLARAYSGLARVYLIRGQPDAARRSLESAVKFDPRSVENRALYAACLAQMGDLDSAREHLQVARVVGSAPLLVADVVRRFPQLAIESRESE